MQVCKNEKDIFVHLYFFQVGHRCFFPHILEISHDSRKKKPRVVQKGEHAKTIAFKRTREGKERNPASEEEREKFRSTAATLFSLAIDPPFRIYTQAGGGIL